MFTGLYPTTLSYLSNLHHLADRFDTLPELLNQQGFRTAGFVSGYPLKAWRSPG
jgi:arylsulfatase A-like enzyme